MTHRLRDVTIPAYFGSDWDNVTLELAAAFSGYEAMAAEAPKRVSIMDRGGLTWPWESLHVEALAWFDRWLKERDTGIDEGPPIRYFMPGAGEWLAADSWPPEGVSYTELGLDGQGRLGGEGAGEREYLFVPPALVRMPNANPPPLPTALSWDTPPASAAFDVVGHPALELDAVTSGQDVDWIVKLALVRADGSTRDLTEGWLRGSHRTLDTAASRPGRPRHLHQAPAPVEPGTETSYVVGLSPTAQRVEPGERLRVLLTSCDHQPGFAMVGMTHLPLGRPSRQTVLSSSRLQLPVVGEMPR
jgi:predicted acyl esterase